MFSLLYAGKEFGVSANLWTVCSIAGAGRHSSFFDYDWRRSAETCSPARVTTSSTGPSMTGRGHLTTAAQEVNVIGSFLTLPIVETVESNSPSLSCWVSSGEWIPDADDDFAYSGPTLPPASRVRPTC